MKKFRYFVLSEYEKAFRPQDSRNVMSDYRKARRMKAKYGSSGKRSVGKGKRGSLVRDIRQRVSIMNSYRRSKDLNLKNLKYIQKEGKGRDGATPDLFGFTDGYEKKMSSLSFRIILSPENQAVDIRVLTKEFVRRLEDHTGFRFRWVAAEHYDKPHKHVHILIDGVDLSGRDVRFPREYMKYEMRNIARNISTELVGPRSIEEHRKALLNSCSASRFTDVDRILERMAPDGEIRFGRNIRGNTRQLLHMRLTHLVKLNLCHYEPTRNSFILQPDWDEQLRLFGRYNSFLRGMDISGVLPALYSLHDVRKDGPIQGEVIKQFFMQEDSNNHAVVLRKDDGHVAYVPLPFAPEKVKIGEQVSVSYNIASELVAGQTRGKIILRGQGASRASK